MWHQPQWLKAASIAQLLLFSYSVTPCLKIAISWKPASSLQTFSAGRHVDHIVEQLLPHCV